MKKKKIKLWKKVLVGFLSVNMFLGNLSSLSIEAYAAEEGIEDVFEEDYAEADLSEGTGVVVGDGGAFNEEAGDYVEGEEEFPFDGEESAEASEGEAAEGEPEEVSVTYYGTDGSLLDTVVYTYGSALEFPASEGDITWQDEYGNTYSDNTSVISNLSLYAVENRSDKSQADEAETEETEDTYEVSLDIVDQDGLTIKGYNRVRLPEFTGELTFDDFDNPPVEVDGYEYTGATVLGDTLVSLTADEAGNVISYTTPFEKVNLDSDITVTLVYNATEIPVEIVSTIVDEFGDTIDASYIEMPVIGFDEDGILKLDDPETPPVLDVKVRTGLFRSVSYTYVRSSIDGKTIRAIRRNRLKNGAGTSYSYTVDGESWTVIKEDSTVLYEYTDGKKSVYTYEDDNVKVTATLQHAKAVPDDAYFAVTPVTVSNGYDVDTYLKALNKKADAPDDVEDFEFSESNTLLYDIAFYADETMTEEIEPADGMVRTEIEFKKNQLSDDISASDDDELLVNHLTIRPSIMKEAGNIANAEVDVKDIKVESVDASVSVETENLSFQTESFSLYAITYPAGASAQIVIEYDELPSKYPYGFVYVYERNNKDNKHALMSLDRFEKDGNRIVIDKNTLQYSSLGDLVSGTEYGVELLRAISPEKESVARNDINMRYDQNLLARIVYSEYAWMETEDGWRDVDTGVNSGIIDMYTYTMPENGVFENGKYTIKIEATRVPVSAPTSIAELFGEAACYGIVADSYKNIADTRTNFAVNTYNGGDAVGSEMSNDPGAYYIGSIDATKERGVQIRNTLGPATVYYGGGDLTRVDKETEHDYYDANGVLVIQDDTGKATVIGTDAETVAAKVESLTSGVSLPEGPGIVLPTVGTVEQGNYYLDTTMLPSGTVHIDLDSSTGAGQSLYDIWSVSHKVYINKNPDQTIIFHSKKTDITLNEFNVCNDGSGTYINTAASNSNADGKNYKLEPIARTLIFDLPEAENVEFDSAVVGAFYAPKATVSWNTICAGWLVCDKAQLGSDGVWQFIYQNMPMSDEDDHTVLDLTITKRLTDNATGEEADASLWPSEGFTFKVSKYPCNDDGDINKKLGVIQDIDQIPNLPGMDENGVKYVTIKSDQAGKKVSAGEIEFSGASVWQDSRALIWSGENDSIDHKYIAFMYKIEEMPSNDIRYTTDPKTYYVKFFINCREVQNGNVKKYYVWVDGPHVANAVVEGTVCEPIDVQIMNYVGRTEIGQISVRKVWSDIDTESHDNDEVTVQLTKLTGDYYVDVAGKTVRLNKDNNWNATFDDLEIVDTRGNEVTYGVREVGSTLSGGITTIMVGTMSYEVEISGDNNSGFVITNSARSSKEGVIEVTKQIEGKDYSDNVKYRFKLFGQSDAMNPESTLNCHLTFTSSRGREVEVERKKEKINGKDREVFYFDLYADETVSIGGLPVLPRRQRADNTTVTFDFYVQEVNAESDANEVYIKDIDNFIPDSANPPQFNVSKRTYNFSKDPYAAITYVNVYYSELTIEKTISGYSNLTDAQKHQIMFTVTGPSFPEGTQVTYDQFENGKYKFTGLKRGEYTVRESGEDIDKNYSCTTTYSTEDGKVTIDGDHPGTVTVNNAYELSPVSFTAKKIWNDDNNAARVRPSSIDITLYKTVGGVKTAIRTQSVTGTGNTWTYTFEDLPAYENDQKITYSVEEDSVAHYKTVISDDGATITNTYETVYVEGKKTWDDNKNQDGKRPSSITIVLTASTGEVYKKAINLTASNRKADFWSWRFDNLPKYADADGTLVTYAVSEEIAQDSEYSIPENGIVQGIQDPASGNVTGANITNKHTPGITSYTVTKSWDDNSNQDGIRTDNVSVTLVKTYKNDDNEEVSEDITPSVELSADNNWTYTWSDLDKYENGEEITYSVREDNVPSGYEVSYEDNMVINSHTPEVTSVSVTKVWEDDDNREALRPVSINVTLKGDNGASYSEETTLNAENGWTHEFTNLPKKKAGTDIVYTIEETVVSGYDSVITGNAAAGFTITNTHTPEVIPVSGSKTWNDDSDRDGLRPESLTVYLLADGVRTGETATANESNGWSWTFSGLKKYKNVDNSAVEIEYTVEEDTEWTNSDKYDAPVYSEDHRSVTNTHKPAVTAKTVKKIWNDADNQDGIRPTEIELTLYGDGEKVTADADGNAITTVKLTASNAVDLNTWSYTFDNLLLNKKDAQGNVSPITYTVLEEVTYDGYSAAASGLIVTNTHEPEKTSVTVKKSWDDENDAFGIRPKTITLTLYKVEGASKEQVGEPVTVRGTGNEWTYTFTDLDKYSDGEPIVYSVEEVTGEPYESEVKRDENDAYLFNITNKYELEYITVEGTKTWSDEDNFDGSRPETIIIELTGAGRTWTKEITGSDKAEKWSWKFDASDKIPKYYNGEPATYTISERSVTRYSLTETSNGTQDPDTGNITGMNLTNSYSPDKMSFTVTKTWDDGGDQDALRPGTLTVVLEKNVEGQPKSDYATYELALKDAVDETGNVWSHTWENLPVLDHNKEITYTVREEFSSESYTATKNGNSITNKHTPEVISIKGSKEWDDDSNRDCLRPDRVTIELYKTGTDELVASTEALADPGEGKTAWAWEFTGIAKFDHSDEPISYYVKEVKVNGYDEVTVNRPINSKGGVDVNGESTEGIVFTNKHVPETVDVEGTKTWNDDSNRDGLRPDSIKIVLYADGEIATDESGEEISVTLTAADATAENPNVWAYEFTDLPKNKKGASEQTAIVYTVNETVTWKAADSYTAEYTDSHKSVENTHEIAVTSVAVNKTWDDSDDQDGVRPESISIFLLANGSRVKDTEGADVYADLSESNGWSAEFTGLPVNENGTPIVYGVAEDGVGTDGKLTVTKGERTAEYTATVSGNASEGFTVTNKYTPEEIEIAGTKSWTDNGNQDGCRPPSIVINLYASNAGETPIKSVTADPNDKDSSGNWKWSFGKLPKYANKQLITYTVKEEPVDGYTPSPEYVTVTGESNTSIRFNNTHEIEKISYKVKKVWSDGDNRDNKRPSSVTIQLLADGASVGEPVVLSSENNWKHEFTGLDKYNAGREIVYSVSEHNVDGYTPSFGIDETDGYNTVTNTYTPGVKSLNGIKVWDDENDQDGKRPGEITVYLLADNKRTGDAVTVSAANNWTFEFTDLPEFKIGSVGQKVVYSVEEESVDGYSATVTKAEGDDYYVTLTNSHTVEKIDISGKKTWDDNNNQDGIVKDDTQIIVDLYKGTGDDKEDTGLSAIAKAPDWTWSFTDLPKYEEGSEIVYSVQENAGSVPAGYEFDEENSKLNGVKAQNGSISDIELINVHQPETISISGKKIWDDKNNQDGYRPSEIVVELYSDKAVSLSPVKTQRVTPDANGNWNFMFEDLPKFEKGELITYTVKESGMKADGTITFTRGEGENAPTADYSVLITNGTVSGASSNSVTIKNSYTPETLNIEGSKIWNDANDQDNVRPDSITIRLTNTITNGTQEVTAAAQDNWKWSFRDLPKYMQKDGKTVLIIYKVEEVLDQNSPYNLDMTHKDYNANGKPVTSGQVTSVSGITFVNTYVPETTSISGTKTWNDDNDRDGSRPSSITVNLLADGEIKESKSVSADSEGNWSYSFNNLPVYKIVDGVGGNKINYTITEDEVYSKNGSGIKYTSSVSGYNITNDYIPETTSIRVEKNWDDANNQDGKRPADVKINLLANGRPALDTEGQAISATLSEANSWKYEFTDLPKYDQQSVIAYSVTEDDVADYSTVITKGTADDGVTVYTVTNSYTPGKTSIGITKIWNDADDRDGVRPDSITVILAADGKEAKREELNDSNDWTYTFTGLDEYKDGKLISYTVTEDSTTIPSTYSLGAPVKTGDDMWSVTNTHEPEVTTISGKKTWDDAGDQDGVRPESITVRLLADGVETDSRTVSEANGWAWTFENLPVYSIVGGNGGHKIDYTITEDAIAQAEGHNNVYQQTVNGYNITNKYTPETVDISGSKTWNDNGDQDGTRPDKITVYLKADGQISQTREVTEADGWAWSFTNLPKFRRGALIDYTIDEADVTGYEKAVAGYDIINTHESEKVEVNVTKRWDDKNDQDGLRPDSVSVVLYAGDTAVSEPVTLSAPGYTYTFTGLDKYAGGTAIQYSIKEVEVTDKKGNKDSYTVTYAGGGTYNLTAINTHTPETVSLTVNKHWTGNNANVNEIEVAIEGRTPDGRIAYTKDAKVSAPDWSLTLSELPKFDGGEEISYYVTEKAAGGTYRQTDVHGNAFSGSVKAAGEPLSADLYNVPLKDITVKKIWANDPGYFGGTDVVNITLYANGIAIRNAQILKSSDWTYIFKDLPVYGASGSNAIEYTVKEDSVFTDYKAPVYSNEDGVLVITNELKGLDLEIEKKWLGDQGQESSRPDSITVKILSSADIKGNALSVFGRIRKVFGGDSNSWYEYSKVTISKADDWKASVGNLPRYVKIGNNIEKVSYAIEEIDVPKGYTSVSNVDTSTAKATIINTANTSVAGFKTWEDAGNVRGYRPGSAEFAKMIELYNNGQKYLTGADETHFRWISTQGDSWSFEFFDLPADGNYTVSENGTVLGYGAPVVDGFTIRNPMQFTQLSVTKVWDDEDNAYLTRPGNISFRLLANGKEASIAGVNPIATLGNTSGESYTWKNLPMLDKSGKSVTYTVEEVSVPSGYTSQMTGSGTAYTVTNRFRPENTSLSVRKVWDDLNDANRLRPSSIQVALTRNGTDIDTVTLSASNNWSYTWNDLATMLPDGTGSKAQYSVREVTQILGYSVSVSGSGTSYVITNYYRTPETPRTPDTPPQTPETPTDTPETPGTPGTPSPERRAPAQDPYNIPDEPTPLAGLSQVLGARRAAAGSVLGARRSPKTGDASNAAAFAAAMASAGAMMGAWFAMRRKKKA